MASFMGRVVTAIKVGLQAFNAEELTPSPDSIWGNRTARLGRYELLRGYRDQNPYKSARSDRYQFIRNIDNPADTVTDFYVGQVYGGTLTQDLKGGAIPIQTENDDIRAPISRLYDNSNWASDKSLFVRHGATYGDVAVKVVDDRQAQRAYLEVLHPGKIHTIERDSRGWITYARIEYDQQVINPATGDADDVFTYREDITPDEFMTFKDDKPFPFFADKNGTMVDTWANEYKFVPLEVTQHIDVGLGWGVSSFFYGIPLIDELNEAWSILNDNQRKAIDIVWAFFASKSSGSVQFTRSDRDGVPIVFLGENGKDPFAMVPNIDVVGSSGNIDRLNAQLDQKQPELQFQRIMKTGNLTAPGVRAALSSPIDRVHLVRSNYDASLVKLNKMGMVIGAINGYDGFEAISGVRALDDERLEHQISSRPVIEDTLAQLEKVNAMQQVASVNNPSLAKAILVELDIPSETVDEIIADMGTGEETPLEDASALTDGAVVPDEAAPAVLDPATQAEVQRLLQEVGVAA